MISNSPPNVLNDKQFPLVPGDTVADAQTMYNKMSTGTYEMGFDALEEYLFYNTYVSQWMRTDVPFWLCLFLTRKTRVIKHPHNLFSGIPTTERMFT